MGSQTQWFSYAGDRASAVYLPQRWFSAASDGASAMDFQQYPFQLEAMGSPVKLALGRLHQVVLGIHVHWQHNLIGIGLDLCGWLHIDFILEANKVIILKTELLIKIHIHV